MQDADERLFRLAEKLQRAADYETGAHTLLQELLSTLDTELTALQPDARVLRGMMHLRPGDGGYRSLSIVEYRDGAETGSEVALTPSSTAWRYVEAEQAPVAIDVVTQEAAVIRNGVASDLATREPFVDPARTMQSLRDRDATHLLALPLSGSAGHTAGMISLEISCRHAVGSALPWAELLPELSTRLVLSSPYILTLPAARRESQPDGILPVHSQWLSQIVPLLRVFARQRQTILITGPTGSGKTYLARWLHDNSSQRSGRFVTVPLNEVGDETSLPQLFGWRRGSFTGSVGDNPGWIAAAEGGTLFLDDVDGLSLSQQEGLLRFLDTGKYRRLGDDQDRELSDVRVIVATNADLRQSVSDGAFREDLFHRINVFPLEVPPLRTRRDEIHGWAEHFGNQAHRESDAEGNWTLTAEAISLLIQRRWPGNLRELKRTTQLAHAMAQAETEALTNDLTIHADHLRQIFERDRGGDDNNPVALLHRLAETLFQRAMQHDGVLDPSVIEGRGLLYDMIWLVALEELGVGRLNQQSIAQLMGQENALANRNYSKLLRRSLANLEAFYLSHGQQAPRQLMDLG